MWKMLLWRSISETAKCRNRVLYWLGVEHELPFKLASPENQVLFCGRKESGWGHYNQKMLKDRKREKRKKS